MHSEHEEEKEGLVKRILLATLILVVASWAMAQQNYPNQTPAPSSSGQTMIKGCLKRSDGGYTLTDKSGNTYQLTGDTAKLSDHVGHEVQITGKSSSESSPTSSAGSTATGAAAQRALEVGSMKHISETCSMGPQKTKTPEERPPMTEKPPQ
jgi:hypothetical protein